MKATTAAPLADDLRRSTPLRRAGRKDRRGTATVEFAVCLPVMAMIVLGTIEASNALFVQQALTSAAYEAANVASQTGGTSANAQTRATAVLSSLGINGATVNITPTITTTTALGTQIVVTTYAPFAGNLVKWGYMTNTTFTAKITIPKL
jgi:Flp pilus assembly protein TadG